MQSVGYSAGQFSLGVSCVVTNVWQSHLKAQLGECCPRWLPIPCQGVWVGLSGTAGDWPSISLCSISKWWAWVSYSLAGSGSQTSHRVFGCPQSECSKRQEAGVVVVFRCGSWPSITSSMICWSAESQNLPRFKRTCPRPYLWMGRRYKILWLFLVFHSYSVSCQILLNSASRKCESKCLYFPSLPDQWSNFNCLS